MAASLNGLIPFLMYFGLGYLMVICFLAIYSKVTPYCEWSLMRQNNKAASIAFSGALLGFVLPLASAAVHSVSLLDYAIWAGVAAVMQLLTYFVVGFCYKQLPARIANDEVAAGLFLAACAIATGVVNAASMSY